LGVPNVKAGGLPSHRVNHESRRKPQFFIL
jgi:hypothetical protein